MADKIKVTLVKSTIGAIPKHKKTVEALGLHKLHQTVELPDIVCKHTPSHCQRQKTGAPRRTANGGRRGKRRVSERRRG